MALKVGDKAPEFSLVDSTKQTRTLSEFLGKKTVIAFYPAAFSGVCAKELCTFRDSLSALNNLDAQVVAISVDPPFSSKAFADQNNLNFPVLCDFTRHVSSQYCGLFLELGGVPGYTCSRRSVFILDNNAVVKYVWLSDHPGQEPNYDEVKSFVASM